MMRFLSWFHRTPKTNPVPVSRRTFRPRLEALEDRCVPTHWTVTSPVDNVNVANSLRWAVAKAGSGDTIDIQISGPIVLTNGELYLAYDVTIDSTNISLIHSGYSWISGNFQSRVFEVAPGAHVTLSYLEIIHGNGQPNNPSGQVVEGVGGAIANLGTLALDYCTVTDNGSSLDAAGNRQVSTRAGGGIANMGTDRGIFGQLMLIHCLVTNNQSSNSGGGIYNQATVQIFNCSVSGNSSYGGGGIDNDSTAVVVASHLVGNVATTGDGGAIESFGQLFVSNCEFLSNHAGFDGAAVVNHNGMQAYNCTFSDNHAGRNGGAISNYGNAGPGTLVVYGCDFLDNSAAFQGGAIYNLAKASVAGSQLINNVAAQGGGIYNAIGAVLNLETSLLQSNSPDNLNNQGTYNDLGGNTFI